MKVFSVLSVTLASLAPLVAGEKPPLILNETVLTTHLIAANLSARAYDDPAWWASNDTATGFFHPEFDSIQFFTDEPDQALVAKKNGYCFLAFRGTNANADDWLQNANLGDANVYRNNDNTTGDFCETRAGFTDFIRTRPANEALTALQACIATCDDPTDCLVITGHSQGGASTAVASILLHQLNPTVVTFGQPPTLDAGCKWIPSDRYYRYVNSMKDIAQDNDMGFDLVVFAPNWVSGSEHYGYYIMLSEDPAAVDYLGFDQDFTFVPDLADNDPNAHSMSGEPYSYETRIANLLANVPITLDGFKEGNICEANYAELCKSGLCVEFECLPIGGVKELCVYNSCEKDDDCFGDNVCIYDSCAAGPGLAEPGCSCFTDDDCTNDNCVTVDLFAADFRCDDSGAIPAGALIRMVLSGMLLVAGLFAAFI